MFRFQILGSEFRFDILGAPASWSFRLDFVACNLSMRIFRLQSFGTSRSGTSAGLHRPAGAFAWDCSLGNFCVRSSALKASIENICLGFVLWEFSFDSVRLGFFVWGVVFRFLFF